MFNLLSKNFSLNILESYFSDAILYAVDDIAEYSSVVILNARVNVFCKLSTDLTSQTKPFTPFLIKSVGPLIFEQIDGVARPAASKTVIPNPSL